MEIRLLGSCEEQIWIIADKECERIFEIYKIRPITAEERRMYQVFMDIGKLIAERAEIVCNEKGEVLTTKL